MHAISGRADALIDRLRVYCRALADASHVAGDSASAGAVGGYGGRAFARIECPVELAASALAVRTGAYVDQVKLVCGR